MQTLKYGSVGSLVELLQLGLERAGFLASGPDGVFGSGTRDALIRFQKKNSLTPDGIYGVATQRAMAPWLLGFTVHRIRSGDTLYSLAERYGSTLRQVELANPGLDPLNLQIGQSVTVPLSFPVVPTGISWSSELVSYCVRGISARYPFVTRGDYGKSVMGKNLSYLALGEGERRVLFTAEHHANEWITTPVLLKFAEELARAYALGESLRSVTAAEIIRAARIYLVPAVNPDGMDLVTGALTGGEYYSRASAIGASFPDIPFPSGWKANILGTDLNLQYPALWEEAKRIKFAEGFDRPAPRDFVGTAPLSAPESRALYDLTLKVDPATVLAYHTQGEVIFWRFLDYEVPGARELGDCLSAASGYALEETPYASGFAGYKDWFIQSCRRPGYTVEAGRGVNPLPVSQFEEIYRRNLGVLVFAAIGGC